MVKFMPFMCMFSFVSVYGVYFVWQLFSTGPPLFYFSGVLEFVSECYSRFSSPDVRFTRPKLCSFRKRRELCCRCLCIKVYSVCSVPNSTCFWLYI